MQNSEVKGQRHLNDRVRKNVERKQRADAFEKGLLANLPANHPARRAAEEKERAKREGEMH